MGCCSFSFFIYFSYCICEKSSVFWNSEINTEGNNSKRGDYSTAVWGYDMSEVGSNPNEYPKELIDGIALGEEFSYEINVYKGIMYLTFNSANQDTKTFTKNLVLSEYVNHLDRPEQIMKLFAPIGQDGTEKGNAYKGELNYFKQGAYNQTNEKDPKKIWCGAPVQKPIVEIWQNNIPMVVMQKFGLEHV